MTPVPLRINRERGAAMLETAMVLPLVMLVMVGIFEFGRAYQSWQVLTNAAREGARIAVLPGSSEDAVTARVAAYLEAGQLPAADSVSVSVTPVVLDLGGGLVAGASNVTVTYPFQFLMLQPVAQLVVNGSTAGAPITMSASAVMRNE